MNKLFLFSTFLILSSSAIPISGNGQECLWASSAGGWKFDGGKKVLSDKSGNTYAIGYLGNSDVVLNIDTLSHGWFAAKYNLSGDVQWTRQFIRGSGPDWGEEGLQSWQFDTIHNVLLLTGSFYQYLNLPDTLIHATGNGLFLIKMDLDGNVIWYKVFDGPGNDQAFGITYDSQGNIYISGSNEEQLIFSRDTLARGGFLAKFDADGNILWAKNKFRFQGHSGSSYPYTEVDAVYMLYSNSSIIINGVAQNDTIIVDTATFINGNAYNSSFLASFNQQGDFQWMYLMGGPSGICGSSFAIDTNNNYYISGVIERKGYFCKY